MTNNNRKKPHFRIMPLERRVLLSATCLEPEVTEFNNPDFHATTAQNEPLDANESLTDYSSGNLSPIHSNYCFELIKTWRFDTSETLEEEQENAVDEQLEHEHRLATSSPPLATNGEVDLFRTIEVREPDTAVDVTGPVGTASRKQFELVIVDQPAFEHWSTKPEVHTDILLFGCPLALDPEDHSILDSIWQPKEPDSAASGTSVGSTTLGDNCLLESHRDTFNTEVIVSPASQPEWQDPLSTVVVAHSKDSSTGSLRQGILGAHAAADYETINFGVTDSDFLIFDELPAIAGFPSDALGNIGGAYLVGAVESIHAGSLETVAKSTAKDVILVDRQLNDSETLIASAQLGSIVFSYDGSSESAAAILGKVSGWASEYATNIRSLSILSHGTTGAFELGNQWVTSDSLNATAEQWRDIANYFIEDANIYILGCNIGTSGQTLLDSLAVITSADVYASDDITGVGGDWTLELASTDAVTLDSQALESVFDIKELQSAEVSLAWYNANWSYRQSVTVSSSLLDGSVDAANFTVLVDITQTSLRSTGNGGNVGQTDGGDFVFTSSDGATKLNHEIESYDAVTGRLKAWVQVPTLSALSNTSLYVYYGNAGAANQWNNSGTWDATYGGVWHLSNSSFTDSTSNANNGTNVSTTDVTGIIEEGRTFNGSSQLISVADSNSLDETNTFSISAWIRPTVNDSNWRTIINKGPDNAGGNYWFGIKQSQLEVYIAGTGYDSNFTVTLNTWSHVAATFNSSTDTLVVYANGTAVYTNTSATATPGTNADPLYIGRSALNNEWWQGSLDEVRFQRSIESENEIRADYRVQNSPGTYVTFASEEGAPVITSNGGGTTASISVGENQTAVTTVTATDPGTPLQTLTYSISGGVDAARFTINSSSGVLTFVTPPNFESPTDSGSNNIYDVIVQVSDGTLTDTQSIAVTITNVNEAPTAVVDTATAVEAGGTNNGTAGTNPTGNVVTNDTDVDASDTKTVTGVAAGVVGSASTNVGSPVTGSFGSINIAANGSYTYTVDNTNASVQALRTTANTLTDVFTYTMRDTAGLTSTTQITVTIQGANDAPVAVSDSATAVEAGGVANGTAGTNPTGNVLTNDTDVDSVGNGETKTVSGVLAGVQASATGNVGSTVVGAYGSINIAANGSYTYTVDNTNAAVQALLTTANTLQDVFTYTLTDANGLTATTQITVTIQGANDAPTIGTEFTGLSTGNYTFVSGGQTFVAYVTQYAGSNWVLIGRGREGWEFDTDGQGLASEVSQNLGAVAAFAPKAYSDAIINDMLARAGTNMTNVELRIMRATTTNGSGEYQEIRWGNFSGNSNDFTWNIEDSPYSITQAQVNAPAALPGAQIGSSSANTNDSISFGNDGDRIFTWAWSSHNNSKGFSYGQSVVGTNGNSATSYLWEFSTEDHAIPYTEVYMRLVNPNLAALTYVENDAPRVVLPTIVPGDLDQSTLQSATVQITGNFAAGQDVLGFTNTANITGSYNASTGVLTLTGTDTMAAYTAALRTVTYSNSSDSPNTLTRTISFTVNDGSLNSTAITRDITITAVNDAPTAVTDTATAVEAGGVANGTTGTNPTGNVLTNDTDPDAGDTKTVSGVAAGVVGSASTNVGSAVAGTFGSITIAANGTYTYTVDNANSTVQALRTSGNTLTDVFTYTMRDTAGLTSTTQITVTIQGANDAPSDLAGALSVNENAANTTSIGTLTRTDIDSGDGATYSLVDNAGGRFAINSSTGVVTVANGTLLNREAAATHNITARITDTAGATYDEVMTVTINDVDEFDVGSVTDSNATANSIAENAANGIVVGITSSASDVDATNNTITYSLDDSAGGRFTIHSSTGVVTVANSTLLNYEAATSHTITVRASSSDTSFSTQTFTINLTDIDEFDVGPVTDSNATANSVAENASNGTAVGITASAADADATNNTITYSLDDSAGGRFTIHSSTGVVTVADGTLLNFEAATSHNITVRATSSDTSFSTAILTINLTNVNEGPVAVLDTATAVEAGGVSNGTAGTNPTGNVLTNDTDVDAGDTKTVSGVAAGVVGSASTNVGAAVTGTFGSINIAANGAFTYTVDNNNATVQALRTTSNTLQDVFTYTMRDTAGLTSTTQITVTIQGANDAPSDLAGPLSVNENAANTTSVGTLTRTDIDSGDGATYSLVDNAGGRFAINSSTGVVTVANGTLLNREAAASHNITVRITDTAGATYDEVMTVTINDVDEFDVGTVTDSNVTANSIAENAANGTVVGITGSASDADATNNTITYSLDDSAGGRFTIHSSTGVVTVANSTLLNFEAATTHNITVRATSSDTSFSTAIFTINLTDVNEGPVAVLDTATAVEAGGVSNGTAGTNPTGNVLTNDTDVDAGDTKTVSGVAAGVVGSASTNVGAAVTGTFGSINIAANGAFTYTVDNNNATVQALRTTSNTLQDVFTYTMRDTAGLTSTTQITVTIQGANDAPQDLAGTLTVNENAANTTSVGTITRTDIDSGDGATYSLVDDAGGRFAINSSTGVVTVANGTLLNREAAATHNITLRITDTAGATYDEVMTVTINDVDEFDVGTVTDSNATANSIAENSANGTVVGITSSASDADATNNTITYTLDDSAGGRFTIHSSTGVVTVANSILLNFEAATSHNITVRATSSDTSFSTQTFTITLTDVDEFDVGSVTDSNATANSVAENASNGTAVGITASASDADATNNTITYSLDDSAGGRFTIHSSTGVVTVADGTLLNFEAATTHNITVRATSSDTSFSTANFTINLTNVNEGPVAVLDTATAVEAGGVSNGTAGSNPTGNVLTNDTDVDAGDTKTVSGVAAGVVGSASTNVGAAVTGTFGSINIAANGAFTYTVDNNNATVQALQTTSNTLQDVFTYTMRDTAGLTSTTQITVTIQGANDAPSDLAGTLSVNENAANTTSVGTITRTDIDSGDGATYSLVDDSGGRFAINSITGVVTVANGTLLNREAAATHNITVRITDTAGATYDEVMTVTVNDVDEFDVGSVTDSNATANSLAENSANGTVVGITGSASDADATNNTITYSLDDSAGGRFTIHSSTGVVTVANSTLLNYEAATSHNIIVRATSSDTSFSTQTFTITLTDVDEFDVGSVTDTNATANSVAENASNGSVVGVTASASDADATNNTITYSLDDSAGGRFTIHSSTGVVTVADGTLLNFEAATTHNITVRATSSDTSFSTAIFTINLTNVNEGPVAVLDTATAVEAGGVSNGTAGSNPTGNVLTNDTDVDAGDTKTVSGVAAGVVGSASTNVGAAVTGTFGSINIAANGAFTYTVDNNNATVQALRTSANTLTDVFTYTMRDTAGLTSTTQITVTIQGANDAPSDLAGALSVNENATNTTSVGTITRTDIDSGDGATYSLVDDSGGRFAINSSTGVVTVANSTLLNREAAATHNITVRITDTAGATYDEVMTVTINDVDEFDVGSVTDSNATANSIAENSVNGTVVGITGSASDADATNNTITYSLDDSAGGRFTIHSSTGVVTVANSTLLNFEAATSHNITVRATSSDTSFSTQTSTITLTDVDEFDVGSVTDTNATANSVAENASNGSVVGVTASASDADATNNTITYSLDDSAGGRFTIHSSTGVVTIADGTLLNFEAATSHNITVRATSSDTSFSTAIFTINLTNVNEGPVAVLDTASAVEAGGVSNGTAGTNPTGNVLTNDTDVDAGDTKTVSGVAAGVVGSASTNVGAAVTGTFGSINIAANGAFTYTVDNNNATVQALRTTSNTLQDVFTYTMRDTAGLTSTTQVTVTIQGANDAPSDLAGALSVNENAANTTSVGTITRTDIDSGDGATYSLVDDAGGRFAINSSTGVVTVANGTLLNREATATHNITVRITDTAGATYDEVMTVTINDVDEFDVGTVTDSDATANSIAENSANGTVVGIAGSASDADATNNTITYTLDDSAGGRFTIHSSTGVVTVANSTLLNFEAATSHNITVRATSSDTSFSTQIFTINLTDVDEFDVGSVTDSNATANSVAENASNGTAVGITASAADADATNNTITYSLDDSAGGRFTIHSSTGVVTVADGTLLNFEAATSHNITVRATSSDTSFSTANFTINLTNVNEGPVAVLDTATAVEAGGVSNGTAGSNPTGNVLTNDTDVDAGDTKTVSGVAAGVVGSASTNVGAAVTGTFGSINIAANGAFTYTVDNNNATVQALRTTSNTLQDVFTYTMRDTAGLTSTTQITVTIQGANDAPSDLAGALTINENAANTTSVGTITRTDIDSGDGATYSLVDDAGGRFSINSSTGVVTVANGTLLNREAAATHNITVRITDTAGATYEEVMTVTINDVDEFDVASVTDSNATANSIAENSANGTVVGITGSASDADATNNTITYSLQDNDGGRFAIDSVTGIVTVTGAIDRETDGPSRNITVRATSSDGSFTDQNFSIAINDVDEFNVGPVTDTNTTTNNVNENASVGTVVQTTALAADADATNNIITYSLQDNDGGRFAIDSVTGIVTVAGAIDREIDGPSRNVTVRATSSDGSLTDQLFSITINDVDEFNVGSVTDTNATTNSVNENAAVGAVVQITALAADIDATTNVITYSLQNDDGGRFAIDSITGVVTVAGAIDREADGPSRTITARALSSDGSFTDQNFSIAINDLDEFNVGAVTDTNATSNNVDENASVGTVVQITALATDADATTNTITYSLHDNDGGRFAIDSVTGVVTVAGAIDREADGASRTITVRATSSDGSFTDQNFNIAINDLDEFNVGAVTDTNATSNNVDENASVGTVVQITALATDADATTNTITFSLHDNDGGRFAIDSVTGVVTVAGAIDREADGASRTITVRATSSDGSYTDQNFSIAINDLDEFSVGAVTDTNATTNNVDENASVGTVVQITALATDADATTNTITYSLQNNDSGRFAIDSVTGVVTVAGAIDREVDGASRTITVRATSSDGSFTDQNFSITINDLDEFNVGAVTDINATSNNVDENASVGTVVQITALATDSDATTNTITYSLQNNDGGRFAIDSVTGVVTVAGAIDREADGASRTITVRATSSDGSFTDQNFNIAINDLDEFNVGAVTDTNATTNNVDENASVGTVVQITAVAADADATTNTISYSLQNNDSGRFDIDSVTGVVTVAGAIDREADGPSRTITVRATSSDGSFTDQNFSITINDLDEFNVGAVTDTNATTNNVDENASVGTVVQITALATDSDATTNTITYSLQNNDGGRFAIDSVTGVVTVAGAIDREADGPSRTITVRATSSDGSFTDQNFNIAINDLDEFNVGAVTDTNATTNNVDENASVGTVVQITAVAADADATTNTISYSLQNNDSGRFDIDSVTGVVTVAGAIDREADGPSRTITVRATSSDGSFTDQNFSIAINDLDEFNVGAVTDTNATTNNVDENASVGTVVQITALATDADATTNTITYSLQNNDSGRFAIDSVTGVVTVAGAIDREADGASRTITVRATSSDGSFTDQSFSIAINDLDEFNVGAVTDTNATTNNVDENASIGTVVQITALATDADATTNTIGYSLQNNDSGRFAIDSVTGVVTVAGAIDREADGASRTITVRATSSDGSFTDQSFNIAINDLDEFNVGAVTDTNATTDNVDENASVGTVVQITALATDADATTNTITYSLQNNDSGRFAIDSVTGVVTVAGAIDREADGPSRTITVRATSSDGSFTDQNFNIAINDLDEFNVGAVTDTNATSNSVDENASVGTVVQITAVATDTDATFNTISYTLQNNDGGRFAIDSVTGIVTVAGAIDREADGASRTITVRATSSDGSFTDQNFNIAINDLDEFNVGAVTDTNATSNNVDENASVGTVVQITAVAADADATTNTITYSLQNNDGGRFAIDSVTGVVTVAGAIDREADGPSRTITVRATSSDGSFTDQNFNIAINDLDEFNVGPVTDTNATTNNVDENAAVGTVVQITALATDDDATTNTITYSLQNSDGGRFAIDSVTGVVTVAGAIDREADGASRTITVRATSSDGSFTDQNFNIAINDLDEFNVGAVTDTNATSNNVDENSAVGTVVQITALATDADATTNTITYSLHDNDDGRFAIDSVTGVVTVAGSIDREADGPSRTITVRATSSDGSFTDQNFNIAINDIDEFNVGAVTDTNVTTNNVDENASVGTVVQITALATDADATTNIITYTLQNNDGGRFTIDSVTGIVTVAGTIDREADGTSRTITVRATSSDGSFTDQNFNIAINDLDEFNVGVVTDTNATTDNVDENASVGTVVQITALAADADATTNTITYTLQNNDGGRFAIDSVTGVVTVAGAIDREADGPSRTITVRATSSDGSFTDQNFNISINDLDEFNVGAVTDTNATSNSVDENASVGTVVQITAVAADVDATFNTISYTLQNNDGGRFNIDSVTGVVTVAGAIDREADGASRTITVRATSSDGSFTDQNFNIAINDLDEFNIGAVTDTNATSNNVDENASVGTVVQITAVAADADATTNTISYSLQNNDSGRFAIDSVTGVVTVAGAIDREADGPSRTITIRATSSDGSFADQNFNIAINDLDEFNVGTVTDTNATSNNVDENASVGTVVQITALATDADATTNTISYSLQNNDGGRFAIDSVTGVVTVVGAIDREADGPSRTITVRATSSGGSFTDQNFNIAINDLDEFNVGAVTDTNATSNNVDENASVGTVVQITAVATDTDATTNTITYSLQNNDGGRFAIDSVTGVVTVAGSIDREADGASRTITVRATSSDGSFTDQNFNIAINDLDEFNVGPVTDTNATSNNVDENASVGTVVQITAVAADADATTNTITYSLQNNDGGRFAIDSVTGVVSVAGAIDCEAVGSSRTITVRATSSDGSFTDQLFHININDLDEYDVGLLLDANNSPNVIQEHSAVGTVVGLTVLAVDQDATTNTISYQLLDDSQGRFGIDSVTGIVTVANSSLLRYELGPNYTITVRADSADGSFSTAQFQITLDNLNDAPFAVDDLLSLNENGVQSLDVLGNDYDLDPGDTLQIIAASVVSGLGNLSLTANAISYDPGAHYDYLSIGETETVELSYTISDANGLQSTASATLTIQGARDALVLNAPTINGSEDNTIVWSISVSPVDVNGETLTSVVISGLPEGTILTDNQQQAEVRLGLATDIFGFDLNEIYIRLPQHVSGIFVVTIETRSNLGPSSTQSIARIFDIYALADSPSLSVQDAHGQLGEIIPLRLASQLIDLDGSEELTVEVRGLPSGMTLTDGILAQTVNDANSWIDISNWILSDIVLQTQGGFDGIYSIEVRVTAQELSNQDFVRISDTIQLTVDQVLPITQFTDDRTNDSITSIGNETDSVPSAKSSAQSISIHPAHDTGHAHSAELTEEPLRIEPTDTTKSTISQELGVINRSDNPSSVFPGLNLARSRVEAVEEFSFNGVKTRRGTADEPAGTEQTFRTSRHVNISDEPDTPSESLTLLGNLNNTLLLAWTMIRSSISNLLVTGDGVVADEKKPQPLFKDDEKHQKAETNRKK